MLHKQYIMMILYAHTIYRLFAMLEPGGCFVFHVVQEDIRNNPSALSTAVLKFPPTSSLESVESKGHWNVKG